MKHLYSASIWLYRKENKNVLSSFQEFCIPKVNFSTSQFLVSLSQFLLEIENNDLQKVERDYTRCFARFGTTCAIRKRKKTPLEDCYFK